MGVWGTGLYQNDTSLDVKDEFTDKLHRGKSPEEITAEMIEEYSCVMDDPNEAPFFWLALADAQWKRGMLLPEVKEKALSWIDNDDNVALWADNPNLVAKRKKVIDALKLELLSPQPPRKTYKPYKLYKCEWKIGDVYAYRLEGEAARGKGLFGKYFLMQKIDEDTWHPGHIIPVVYIKLSQSDDLPASLEDYNKLEYVQVFSTPYKETKWPDWMPPIREIVEREAREKMLLDEFGFLPEFRLSLISTAKRTIPKKLIYVGNFIDATPPQKEHIPSMKVNLLSLTWKEFEEKLIDKYFGYNKREYKIYRAD